jgi:carboxyl-terminal processing protease
MKLGSKKVTGVALACSMVAASLTGCGLTSTKVNRADSKTETNNSTSNNESTSDEFDVTSSETAAKTKEIESLIDNYFYFDQDEELREESYYDGLLEGLDDPYSVYYTPEEYEKLMEDDGGEYVGIGAVVSRNMETMNVYVVKPIVGSPAEAAGILPEDIIVSVGDVDVTTDMELDEVVSMIRGEEGTTVTLKIYREGDTDYRYIDVTRAVVQNVTVSSEMLDDNIGYIQVEQFIENTPEQFEEQIDDLLSQGAEGLVIDLRDNPGGLLTAVTEMCDYIVPDDMGDGLIVSTKDKNDRVLEEWKLEDGHSVDVPMVVLVNGNSASASEIFTGCMKDYGLATIVGTTTYGKGIVQSVIPLSDGSAIKITIAKYFTPSGNDIHKVGIEPDVEVELPDEVRTLVTIPHDQDTQLQKAIEILTMY